MFQLLHLDYLSCLLTILSTVMVGRRMWQGWLVAGANSVIITAIGIHTGQWGFVPANLFCIGIYLFNVRNWRASGTLNGQASTSVAAQARPHRPRRFVFAPLRTRPAGDERLARNRIRARSVPNQRESRSPL
ncbi:MAG TPA: hypothetical protein VF532_18630 [Candidatus Angelobacter sp.]